MTTSEFNFFIKILAAISMLLTIGVLGIAAKSTKYKDFYAGRKKFIFVSITLTALQYLMIFLYSRSVYMTFLNLLMTFILLLNMFIGIYLLINFIILVLDNKYGFSKKLKFDIYKLDFIPPLAKKLSSITIGKSDKGVPISVYLKEANKDDTPYFKRVLKLAVPLVGYFYMVFFFGVTELYFGNINEWEFMYSDIAGLAVIPVAVFGLLVSFVIPIFAKGKILNVISVIASSVFIVSYIQNLFFNSSALLNGSAIVLYNQPLKLMLNSLCWEIAIILPLILTLFIPKLYKLLAYLSAVMFAMQLVPLPMLLIGGSDIPVEEIQPSLTYDLDGEEQFTVSSTENVMVFIMDAFHDEYLEDFLEENPEYNTILSDFTFYNNINTQSIATALSMPHLLTAHPLDNTICIRKSNAKAWESDSAAYFYNTMHENGYKINFYTDSSEYSGGAENMRGKIDNVQSFEVQYETNSLSTYLQMLKISFYRYSPYTFKQKFWMSDAYEVNRYTKKISERVYLDTTSWMNSSETSESRGISFYNYDYYANQQNIKDGGEQKRLVIQHLHGMHAPFLSVDDENRSDHDEKTATRGCLQILIKYIETLKANGTYDNSTIIMTADHGKHELFDSNPVMLIKPKGYKNDKLVVNKAPGDLQDDLLPTVLDCVGLPYEQLGTSILSLDEDAQRTRIIRSYVSVPGLPPIHKCTAIGMSCVNGFYEYKYTGTIDDLDISVYTTAPLTDYWW